MIGQKLGHYEILAKIGEGGMGEVYRALDPRLGREVAIKVLTSQRLENDEARARFEREARAVAALSHPNILVLHDFGEHDGTAYAVTELLQGETLLEELRTGPIPVRRAIELGSQIADGLAAAHEHGIVHRDLKPANIFVLPDGRLKILDFGLAKSGLNQDVHSMSATLQDGTAPGTVLGTVRYMSPEQVRGVEVDARSDLFSFGTVLWEMVTGAVAFQRDSAVETMNAILKEDPPELSTQLDHLPASVERIIRHCMEKSPERRFQSAPDLAFALRNSLDSSSRGLAALDAPAPSATPRSRLVLGGLILLAAGALSGAAAERWLNPAAPAEPVRISHLTHSGTDSAPSASPDGSTVAFVSERDGTPRIWLRQMKGGTEVPLTDGPDGSPAFSPDGSTLLFLRREGSALAAYRVPVLGGAPRKLLDNTWQVQWSPDGREVAYLSGRGGGDSLSTQVSIHDIATGSNRGIYSAEGRFLHSMDWSPDGRWLVLTASSAIQNTFGTVLVIDAQTGELQWLKKDTRQFSAPTWFGDSQSFLFAESSNLLGDLSSSLGRVVRVDPFRDRERSLFWVQSVWAGNSDFVRFDFLAPDRIVFDEILWQGSLTESSLAAAGQAPRDLTSGSGRDRQPAYSPDGQQIVFSSNRSGNLDIWILDRPTGRVRQLTDDAAEDWDPAFSSDGRSVLWSSSRSGNLEIWTASVAGSGARQVTHDGVDAENPTQSPDGAWVYYACAHPGQDGVWRIRTDGTEAALVVPGVNFLPELSPDGNHVAYVNNDATELVVHLRVSDTSTGELVFNTDVAYRGLQSTIQPGRVRWSPDGQSLYFVAPDNHERYVLYTQRFTPHEDTRASCRPVTTPGGTAELESFGISPDGQSVTYARVDHHRSLKLAEGDFSRWR